MREIQGRYASAKVFTDVIEKEAIDQIEALCNQEFARDSKLRIMPDVHAGAGCTIGTTMRITDVDIKGFFDHVNHRKLMKQIYAMNIRDKKLLYIIQQILKPLFCYPMTL